MSLKSNNIGMKTLGAFVWSHQVPLNLPWATYVLPQLWHLLYWHTWPSLHMHGGMAIGAKPAQPPLAMSLCLSLYPRTFCRPWYLHDYFFAPQCLHPPSNAACQLHRIWWLSSTPIVAVFNQRKSQCSWELEGGTYWHTSSLIICMQYKTLHVKSHNVK